jgi:hypothetical protein
MTWEVANEPHTSDYFEYNNDGQTLGDRKARISKYSTGALAGGFICKAAAFLKSAAPRQLIASGVKSVIFKFDVTEIRSLPDFYRASRCANVVECMACVLVSVYTTMAYCTDAATCYTCRVLVLLLLVPCLTAKDLRSNAAATGMSVTWFGCRGAQFCSTLIRRLTQSGRLIWGKPKVLPIYEGRPTSGTRFGADVCLALAGEEGYKSTGKVLSDSYAWLDNGLKGVDFPRNARCKALDYMTVHVYPDNWGIPFWNFRFATETYMKVRTPGLVHPFVSNTLLMLIFSHHVLLLTTSWPLAVYWRVVAESLDV